MTDVYISGVKLTNWKMEMVPVYQTLKFKKSEANFKDLEEVFDIVLDDFADGWTCKKSTYRELQISFETSDEKIMDLIDSKHLLNVKLSRELICLGEWSFEDLESGFDLISGKLRGTIAFLERIEPDDQ